MSKHKDSLKSHDLYGKMWPNQRATVARLGLLHRNRSNSTRSSISVLSTDTFESNSSPANSKYALGGLKGFLRERTRKIPSRTCKITKNEKHASLAGEKSHTTSSTSSTTQKGKLQSDNFSATIKKNLQKECLLTKVVGEHSWVTCADFKNSQLLKMKSPEEREEFTDLCAEAIAEKLKTFEELEKMNDEAYQEKLNKVSLFNQNEYKSQMCAAMLELVRKDRRRITQLDGDSNSFTMDPEGITSEKDVRYIYVVRGRIMIRQEPLEIKYPNSFARLTSLMDPKRDSPGYHRFRFQVDLHGIPTGDLTILLYNKKYLVFTVEKVEGFKKFVDMVQLPQGVFADKLIIAREEDGPLFFQESWQY